MNAAEQEALARSPAFRRLVARNNRFAWGWTALVLAGYLAFDVVSMSAPGVLSMTVGARGILTLGVLVAFALSLLCVLVAAIAALRKTGH